MQQLLLGVDVGTTATKAVLIDLEGKLVAQGRAEYPTIHLQAGWVEQDAEQWWISFCKASAQAISQISDAKIIGVAISSQAPTLLAVDNGGRQVRNALIWMDRRAQQQADQLAQKFSNISNLTGNRADPYYVAAKIMWLKQNEPENYAKSKFFLQIPGYLNYKLTGKFSLDSAHASLLQLRNADNRNWSTEVLDFIGIDQSKFPPIGLASDLLGEVIQENEAKIPVGTPVYFGTVDGCSAAVETGVIDPGVVAEMTGTSTVLIMPTDGNNFNDAFVAIDHAIANRQLRLGAMVAAGASVAWLMSNILKDQYSMAELTQKANTVAPGSEGLIFLPYMMGERSPIWNTNARGVFFGLTLTTTPEMMFRAVLEGTAFALAHNVEIGKLSGIKIDEIRSIGGGSKSELWNQIKADVLGLPIAILKDSSGAAVGDAYLAGVGAGVFSNIKDVINSNVSIENRYLPNKAHHDYYQERYARFRNLYESLKSEFNASAASAKFGVNK
ncbi:MAG: FGGY-family carbohydrate kinase [Candidatus Nanopelagicus sp.]